MPMGPAYPKAYLSRMPVYRPSDAALRVARHVCVRAADMFFISSYPTDGRDVA